MGLQNKVVLVTGSTGHLGPVVIQKFLEHPVQVVAAYRSDSGLKDLNKQVGESANFTPIQADLAKEDAVKNLFRQIESRFGRLDVLAHCAGGFWMGGSVDETPADKWHMMFSINLETAFLCGREAMRMMKKQKSGRIFTVSSKNALELPAGMAAYTVSKAALLAFTQILAAEGKAHNIQVNSIVASVIDTEANRQAMGDAEAHKWVKPEHIAEMMITLSDDELTIMSGTAIKMYGKL